MPDPTAHNDAAIISRIENVMFRAIDFCQRAEKIPHLRRVHEFIVIIVRTVTRPDLSARLDIARGDENKIGVLAELVDRGVLKMGFDAIDLPWGKINSADMAAEIFAIEKFVRLGFIPCAFGNRRQIVIAAGCTRPSITCRPTLQSLALFEFQRRQTARYLHSVSPKPLSPCVCPSPY